MGARGTGGGVEARVNCIRLHFTWGGKRRRETLALKPTPVNLRAASRLMDDIRQEIRLGVFVYARHFPESAGALVPTTLTSFRDYATRWLKTLTTEYGTTKNYRSALEKVWMPEIGDKKIGEIKHSDIKVVVASRRGRVSGKTVNNDLIPLRAVFDEAVADGLLAASPARQIKNLNHQVNPPDPFTLDEVRLILSDLEEHAPTAVFLYYKVAFAAGLRPSEQIIARWRSMDFLNGTLRIDTALTRGQEKGTKTSTVRDVDLTPAAWAAILAMKPLTFMKGGDHPIFVHPATGRPWTNDQYQRVTYFQPCLRRLGIRMRDAYQTRHTYATIALMGGIAPAYIARQMGHTNAAMVFRVYARWIDGADKGREAARLAAVQGGSIVPGLSPAGEV